MNDFFEEDQAIDTSGEEARLTRLIEALASLVGTRDWQTVTDTHFRREQERISRLILIEAKKLPLDENKIYQLQGEYKWAVRYGDIEKWVMNLTNQLSKLKKYEQK